MNIPFLDRGEIIQLWVLLIIQVGNFVAYGLWKKFGTRTTPTLWGIFKKFLIGIAAWFLFIIIPWDWNNISHTDPTLVVSAFNQGIMAEYIIGAHVQQYIERREDKVKARKMIAKEKDQADKVKEAETMVEKVKEIGELADGISNFPENNIDEKDGGKE
jgi:ABC-type anion transport system duplicated permease subunit